MTDRMTFAEAVSISEEENYGLTDRGLDHYYDILAHLADGGTVHNYGEHTADEVVAWLAVGWVSCRMLVNANG